MVGYFVMSRGRKTLCFGWHCTRAEGNSRRKYPLRGEGYFGFQKVLLYTSECVGLGVGRTENILLIERVGGGVCVRSR